MNNGNGVPAALEHVDAMKHPHLSFVRGWTLQLALALLPVALPAQVTFSFSGTANNTALGFNSGNVGSFFITISGIYAGGADDSFDGTQNIWGEDVPPVSPLYTAFGGTAVTGTFTQFSNPDSYATLTNSESGGNSFMYLQIWGIAENIGLSVNGVPITNLQLSLADFAFGFTHLLSFENPADYFSDFVGSYGAPAGGGFDLITNSGGLSFTLTGYSITSPIPEPSTYAAIFGAAALGFAAWRRRPPPG